MTQSDNGYSFHNVVGKAWESANYIEREILEFEWHADDGTPEKALEQWNTLMVQVNALRGRMSVVAQYLSAIHQLWDYTPEEDVSRETYEEGFDPFKDVPPVDPADEAAKRVAEILD